MIENQCVSTRYLRHATCDFSVLFFSASVCVYWIVLNELLVCLNDSVKLCFTILCTHVLCCNFMQSIGKFLCPHTQTIKILYSGSPSSQRLVSQSVSQSVSQLVSYLVV